MYKSIGCAVVLEDVKTTHLDQLPKLILVI